MLVACCVIRCNGNKEQTGVHKIAVLGVGYVGMVTGVGLAEIGNCVVCADIDRSKIELLKQGHIPIYEPGLDELVLRNVQEGRLEFTTDIAQAIRNC